MLTIRNKLYALLSSGGLLASFALLGSCSFVSATGTLSIQLRNSGNESVFDCAVFYLDTQERINGLFSMELVPTGTARHTGFPYRVPEELGVEWISSDGEKHTSSVVASSLIDKSVDGVLLIEVNHPQVTSSFIEEPPIDWAARLERPLREPVKLRPYMVFLIENSGSGTIDGLKVENMETNEELAELWRKRLRPKDGFRLVELRHNPPMFLKFSWITNESISVHRTIELKESLPEDFMGVVYFTIVNLNIFISWRYSDNNRHPTSKTGGYRFNL